jgi:hypothetical protein
MSDSNLVAELDAAILTLQEARDDAAKVDKGKTGAPGTRLRKAAQNVAHAMGGVRKKVLELRKA